MRYSLIVRSILSLLLISSAPAIGATTLLAPSSAAAQDEFDDDFDEDFEDSRRGGETTESSGGGGRSGALEADEFDDEADSSDSGTTTEDDTFDDEGDTSDEAASGTPEVGGSRARGDLLSADGSPDWRRRRFVLGNTWHGATGGIHVVDAGGGPSQTFRAQLLTDFFFAGGFLNAGDQNDHIGGSLSLSWSPWDFLELYASIQSHANSNPTESPGLFQVLGDSVFGVRGYYEILPFLIAGGDISVYFLNTVGDIGLVGESTSLGIRGNLTFDGRGLDANIPLIARLNLQYYIDNSSALTNRVEEARYANLPTTGPEARRSYADEDRHLLTRVERFALGINRTDFFDIGIGFEAPLEVIPDFFVSPIAEWVLRIPVNRSSYSCLFIPGDGVGSTTGDDGCLERQGFSSFPSTLTLGVRVQPLLPGLAITAAVDIGTSGMSTFVRELAGNAPYDVILGFSYAYDTRSPEPVVQEREVERRVEVRVPPPVRGRLVGTIVERGTTTPVSGAVVAFSGRELTALSSSADGRFTTYEMDPGEVQLAISHPEYNSGTCSGTIGAEGGDVTVSCELDALPRLGTVRGSVVSDSGAPVPGATLQISGPQTFTVTADPSGQFNRAELPPGTYSARVDGGEGFLLTTETFEVRPRETATPTITIVARPARSQIILRQREIAIRRQVNFATDSADILPDSHALLAEIADVLQRHPEITRIEIQGHTDNRGGSEHNMDLSQRRADAVREWLIAAGVSGDRLVARGYGDSQPLVPNITAANRARNRRVQFIIQDRAAE